jgi:type II secretory pathway pseudopilin PulG
MRLKAKTQQARPAKRYQSAFTLAEVLAALAFMAIVIPVAVESVQVASLAGQVGMRKTTALRIAQNVLNEQIVSNSWQSAGQSGTVDEGAQQYRWQLLVDSWNTETPNAFGANLDGMSLVTVQVTFSIRGRDYTVRLSSVVDNVLP